MELLSNMEPLTIALIVLVIAGVWAVVELALFLRRTRKGVADITDSLNQTIAEFQPTVSKLDGIVDELGSSSKQVEPLLEKASTTVDLVNVNLVRTESVLADVNTATNTAANLSNTVSATANNAAAAVAGAVNKVAGKVGGKAASKLEAAPAADVARLESAEAPAVEHVKGDEGYFTYPGAEQAQAAAEAAAPAAEAVAEAAAPVAEAVAEAAAPAAEAVAQAAAPAAEAAVQATEQAAPASVLEALSADSIRTADSAE